jgi:anaerobic selenocysteine-containing dehydrogenase
MMREFEAQLSRGPYPTLLVHPADAEARGIVDGAAVEVASAHGVVGAIAEVSHSIRAGAVSLTHAWSSPNVNALTSDRDADPITRMPRFTGLPVTVTSVAVGAPATQPAWR